VSLSIYNLLLNSVVLIQMLPTPNIDGSIRLRRLGLAATDRRELVVDALEKPAQVLHELMLPLGQLLSLTLEGLSFAVIRAI